MTETAAAGAGKAIQELLEIAAKLTPAEREELQRHGAIIPHFGTTIGGQSKYGYRCKHCGKIGLEFIGEKFDNGAGQTVSTPPLGMRVEHLPWAQPKLQLQQVIRGAPRCQYCLATLPTSNGYLIERFVVIISDYESRRDKAFEEMREMKFRGDKSQATHNHDGMPINVSTNYDANPDRIIAETRARQEQQTPGITQAVGELAAKGDLLGFLSKGPSGSRGKRQS